MIADSYMPPTSEHVIYYLLVNSNIIVGHRYTSLRFLPAMVFIGILLFLNLTCAAKT